MPGRRLLLAALVGAALLLSAPASAPAAAGDILVADFSAFGSTGGVIRVDPLTGARTTISRNTSPAGAPLFEDPYGIALAANADILVSDPAAFDGLTGGLIRVSPTTGARATISRNTAPPGGPGFAGPLGIALAANGDILVADATAFAASTGGLIGANPTTGARATLSSNTSPAGAPSFARPVGIALARDGSILVADEAAFGDGGGVIRVNPATGVRTAVSWELLPVGGPSFEDPTALALAANGDILVADRTAFGGGGGVIRVNPTTGARTTVSRNTSPAGGPNFVDPYGIALAANGDILVVDGHAFGGQGGVIRVNPTTGARTAVSQNAGPAGGPSFAEPFGIAVVPCRTSSFTLGKVKHLSRGSVTLPVAVPCPGRVEARDANDKSDASAAKRRKKKPLIKIASATATKTGTITLTLKPTTAGKRLLRKKHKARVKVKVTYTRTGGAATSKTKTVTLRKKRKHRH